MLSSCTTSDTARVWQIINEAATAYKGIIPADRWHEPYMPLAELQSEIEAGVEFTGYRDDGELVGVMGSQDVLDVTLIRHAYVLTDYQGRGIGGRLLEHVLGKTSQPLLVGTWTAAVWAIRFYERHGFTATSPEETRRLLKKYWTIPERQIETSIVLSGPA